MINLVIRLLTLFVSVKNVGTNKMPGWQTQVVHGVQLYSLHPLPFPTPLKNSL